MVWPRPVRIENLFRFRYAHQLVVQRRQLRRGGVAHHLMIITFRDLAEQAGISQPAHRLFTDLGIGVLPTRDKQISYFHNDPPLFGLAFEAKRDGFGHPQDGKVMS